MSVQTTQVAIIGGGPAGLALSHVLEMHGVESIILEKHTQEHVLSRVRAGLLEPGSVDLLRNWGLSERMDLLGTAKNGTGIVWQNKPDFFIDIVKWTGKQMMAWGQTQLTEDLYRFRTRETGKIVTEALDVSLHGLDSENPSVTYNKSGIIHEIKCRFVAGCDGFHGVSRRSIPRSHITEYLHDYPFGWLGILAEVPPLPDFTYAFHARGFALAAQRNPNLSRYYVQCDVGDEISDWSDDRFWTELLARFPDRLSEQIVTGPSIEKSIAPLRSFVAEPMRYGSLFLAGDAAHIVPPTGAKGLNLALGDVHYLSKALVGFFKTGDSAYLGKYSDFALRRVWRAVNLSWQLTKLLHVFPNEDPFEAKIRQSNYDLLCVSEAAQQALADEYIGAPFENFDP